MLLENSLEKKVHERRVEPEFEIQLLETAEHVGNDDPFPLIYNRMYAVIWIEKGNGEILIDLQKSVIEHDAVYYVRPGQVLTLFPMQPIRGVVISFAKSFLDLHEVKASTFMNSVLFHQYGGAPVVHLGKESIGFIKNTANTMLEEFIGAREWKLEILKGLLKIIMIHISRQLKDVNRIPFHSRKTELTNQFYTLLERHFETKKLVKDYATILCVSPNYLNDSVKEISGYTASYHIQQRIVLEAKRRAVIEGYSLKQIAYHLGFWDPAHFSKYFKNSCGISFTDFKKGHSYERTLTVCTSAY